ncbi:MAG: hypothetical protein IPM29_08705 [Planctomycetes bacterium]|nr:hypothetical protein [Planctomycetota bacterium]
MTRRRSAEPLVCTFRAVLPRTLLTAAVASAGLLAFAAHGAEDTGDPILLGRLGLHVALGLTVAVGALATIDAWPGFGRDAPGRSLLARLRTGPVDGCVRASCGALLALALALPSAAVGFELLRGALTGARGRPLVEVTPAEAVGPLGPLLYAGSPELSVALPAGADRPAVLAARPRLVLASPGARLDPPPLQVLADGRPLLAAPVELPWSGHLLRVPLAGAGDARSLRLVATGARGGAALSLPDGAVWFERAAPGGRLAAAALAGGLALGAAAVALGIATLLARDAARALCAAAALAVLAGGALLGLFPHGAAIEAFAAGSWSAAAGTRAGVLWSLSGAAVAMLGGSRRRRS